MTEAMAIANARLLAERQEKAKVMQHDAEKELNMHSE